MGWDDLEPGQDALVQEDKARRKLAKKVKTAKLTGVGPDEALYTDHYAGDPNRLTPPAETGLHARVAAVQGPVEAGVLQRARTGWASFSRSIADARDERRMRKQGR